MFVLVTVALFVFGTDALLFPMNNGNEPEPELIFACPPPIVPQFGSIRCDYGIFEMNCTAQCNNGFQFEDGSHSASVKCDLFEGKSTPDLQKCVRIGVLHPSTDAPTAPTGTGVTGVPSTAKNCIRNLTDCFGIPSGDYAYCDNCRMFATCAGSGFYVRNCPGIAVFNAALDRCQDNSPTSCRLI
ncbi:uncharacterized protein LOC128546316 [Mercenaria mercenaria]|uniref:uncharacterized protein LOC128546316 n=1 Tax=Mercenaria mercenaria TaxID=6596 RepID=UPI00234F6C47|nr:uncharacterized protein LOC128546316 [Mercenaria mercenaria]